MLNQHMHTCARFSAKGEPSQFLKRPTLPDCRSRGVFRVEGEADQARGAAFEGISPGSTCEAMKKKYCQGSQTLNEYSACI